MRGVDAVLDRIVEKMLAARALPSAPGARGRQAWSLETEMHLENLLAAVDAEAPRMFGAYVSWAASVLQARGVPLEVLRQHLITIREVLLEHGRELANHAILDALAAGETALDDPRHPPDPETARTSETEAYVAAALAGRREEVLSIAAGWQRDGGPASALHRLADAQRVVGDRWMRNEISVALEHKVTALSQLALAALAPFTAGAPGPRPRGRALVCCAEGDWHDMGPRIAVDLLELAGYRADFVGANTPADALGTLCADLAPDLVGIGVGTMLAVPNARSAVEVVRRVVPRARLIAGGFGARVAGREALGVDEVVPQQFSPEASS